MSGVRVVAVALAAWALGASLVAAQDEPSREAVAEARERYERGLQLFEEERLDAALAEFERAFELAPSPPVLFNLGRIHALRGDAVEAVRAFVRYLAEAGEQVRPRERAEVEAEIERQRARIATIRVESALEGAVVTVDGVDAATTPLVDPLRVNSGEHVIGLHAPGYAAETRRVTLAGGTEETLRFDLRPEGRGVLRIEASMPGVEVSVDQRVVGTTPLSATIAVTPGAHVVVGRRAGYFDAHTNVSVEMGAERVVALTLLRDEHAGVATGTLRLALPDAPTVLRVDGQSLDARLGAMELPEGPHAVRIEVAERIPWAGEAWVEAGAPATLRPPLRWTPEERARRLGSANDQRAAGIGTLIAGATLLVGGVVVTGWNEERSPAAEEELDARGACADMAGPGGDPSLFCPGFDRREPDNAALRQQISDLRVVEGLLLGVGAVAAVVGVTVWLVAPDEDAIDEAASATLGLGPAGASLRVRY